MKRAYQADVDAVMAFLYREFSGGRDKVSMLDELDDGRELGDVVAELDKAIRAGDAGDIDERAAAAILCMAELFGGGFDIADEADETSAGLTLAETADMFAARALSPAP